MAHSYSLPLLSIKALMLALLLFSQSSGLAQSIDTSFVNKLIKEANDSVYDNPQQSLLKAKKASLAAQNIGFPKGIALALDIAGYACAIQGQSGAAMDYYKNALKIAVDNQLVKVAANINTDIALLYSNNGDYVNALNANQQAAQNYKLLSDSMSLARSYANMGANNHYMGNYSEAIVMLLHAYKLVTASKATVFCGELLNSVASNYIMLKDYRTALDYLSKSMACLDSAKTGRDICYENLGVCYDKMGKPDSALYYIKLSLQAFKDRKDIKNEIHALINIGEIYLRLKKNDSAFHYFNEGLNQSQKTGYKFGMETAFKNLATAYAAQNEFGKAYELGLKSQALHDSSVNEEKARALSELSARFELKETEQKNQLLEKETSYQKLVIQRKNILLFGSLLLVLLLSGAATLLLRHYRLITNQKLMLLEQRQLQAQMNPHFIYNALNSVQQFIILNDTKNANKYLADFAMLMRQTLDNSKDGNITLSREVAYLNNYLSFEHLRFEDRFDFEIECPQELMAIELPAMIIQPFVENAIRHGLCNLEDCKGHLAIRFYMVPNYLCCEIDDNGIGIKNAQLLKARQSIKHQSHGIETTRKRLALVSKLTKVDYELTILDKTDASQDASGTRIILKFPLVS